MRDRRAGPRKAVKPRRPNGRDIATDFMGCLLVGPGRFERPTSPLSGVRSNQLSYGPCTPLAGALGTPPPRRTAARMTTPRRIAPTMREAPSSTSTIRVSERQRPRHKSTRNRSTGRPATEPSLPAVFCLLSSALCSEGICRRRRRLPPQQICDLPGTPPAHALRSHDRRSAAVEGAPAKSSYSIAGP